MMIQPWLRQISVILNMLCFCIAINKPVYKIVLNSKGYAQFIQYDVDLPRLREFTLCLWVLVSRLESDQTIVTYVGNDDRRVMRLWLESGGKQMRLSLDHDRVSSSASVEFTTQAWRDVCLSYQADYGAWALYVDAQLVLCEASRKVQGFEFPGQGRLIFGYGSSENGSPTGLTGEIYGVSMILYSTIERNTTMFNDFWDKQKYYKRIKIPNNRLQQNQYVILGDLQNDKEKTVTPLSINKDLVHISPALAAQTSRESKKVVPEYPMDIASSKDNLSFHELFDSDKSKHKHVNQKYKDAILKQYSEFKKELTGSGTRDLPIVLEYETPPSITASTADYSAKNSKIQNNFAKDQNDLIISDVERPPPPENNPKVYGQWTSSKFASNVLNYLKNINFNMYKKPKTISVVKLSDSYPYPSKFIYDIIRPPKNFKNNIHTESYHKIEKRATNGRQINVEIIKTDLSDNLKPRLKYLDPKLVEVTNRGEAKRQHKIKSHRNTEQNESYELLQETFDVSQVPSEKHQIEAATLNTLERHRGNNLIDILPFVKSKELLEKNLNDDMKITETNQVYLKSLSNGNKWHNVLSYNNDYTPRLITDLDSLPISANKKKYPFAKPGLYNKQMHVNDVQSMINDRALAKEVSNQANQNYFKVPLSELKHSLVYTHPKITTTKTHNIAVKVVGNDEDKQMNSPNNFNRHVKLGNALNERFIIGYDEQEIKNTFLGGDDAIPDINRHRSKWSSNSSIGPRVCRNAELYVQENEGIVRSKIVSPFEQRNIGIEFVAYNYKECSMNDLYLKYNSLLLIDWIKTPVKLFGGASPEKTTDLCGFFLK